MATVVDALIVTLGLDPKDFTKGQKEAATAFTKTREAATKTGKDIEAASQKAADSIDRIARNALRLFAVFTAGKAIKDFVADITSADSALGRLSQRIGQAPADISAVATAVQRTGGSFDAAAGSFQRFSDSIQELKATGNTGILPFLYRVQAAGGKQINLNKDILQSQVDIADNLKAINDKQGAAAANYYGKQLGFDEGTVALMVQGGKAFRAYIEESKRFGIATKEDTDAAQAFQRSIRTLMQASESLGRSIMTAVTPVIVDLLKPLQEWIEKNREWIKTEITARVREFADYLKTIDWKGVGEGIRNFVSGCNSAAQAVGGWKTVIEALFALWLGSKFLAVLRAIGLLRLALTGGKLSGGLISALGILGSAGLAAILATSAATDKGVANADKPGVITRSDDENTGAATGGGSVFGRLYRWGRRKLGRGDDGAHEGGAGIRSRARRSERATEGGRLNARAPEGAGKYRPEYKVGDADLSQRTADIIAGEAIRHNPESIDAVINNMLNRVGSKGWGPSGNLLEVATAPGQYEAAWKGSKASPSETAFIRERIKAIASGGVPDNTNGSNAYRAGSYRGPWYQKHRDAPVIGGNRYAYEPGAANGPYAPYAKPKDDPVPFVRRPEVLADPNDERRKAARPGGLGVPTMPGSGRTGNMGGSGQGLPGGNRQPMPELKLPSAWNGIPAAAAAVAQVQAAQASRMASVSNDNRSSITNDTRFNGPITVNTAATDANGVARGLQDSLRNRSFAMAANYGQA